MDFWSLGFLELNNPKIHYSNNPTLQLYHAIKSIKSDLVMMPTNWPCSCTRMAG